MPTILRSGVRVHYELAGEGPPLLLLAGLASDGASWAPIVDLLAPRFRLILTDHRGSGRTGPLAPFAFEDFADDAAALLDALHIGAANVVGHSMGGMIALDLAARHPARVRRAVFAATGARPEPRAAAMLGALAVARGEGLSDANYLRLFHPRLFAPAFFARPGADEEAVAAALAYPDRQTAAGNAAQLAATTGLDLSAYAARISIPTLVLAGSDDLLFPPERVRAAFADLPGVRIEIMAHAGHALHWDQPEAFAEAVATFLA